MISKSDIVEAIRVQRERLRKFQSFRRDLLLSLPPLVADYALIISGIRRCGKSTLLAQLSVDRYKPEEVLSLNFDTPLLYGFEFSDFRIVDEVIKEHEGCIALLFDEIQIVDGRVIESIGEYAAKHDDDFMHTKKMATDEKKAFVLGHLK